MYCLLGNPPSTSSVPIDQDGVVLLHRTNLALELFPAAMRQARSWRHTYHPLLHIFIRVLRWKMHEIIDIVAPSSWRQTSSSWRDAMNWSRPWWTRTAQCSPLAVAGHESHLTSWSYLAWRLWIKGGRHQMPFFKQLVIDGRWSSSTACSPSTP